MSPALILDIVIAVMLVVTIGYSVVLYRRLGVLRRSHDDMDKLVRKFAHSIERAQTGLLTLKTTTTEVSSVLVERTEAARAVSDDLGFLTTSADRLADRLDALVGEGRAQASVGVLQGGAPPGPQTPQSDLGTVGGKVDRSETERELMEALRETK
ncbi:MAG: hypothetical protein IH905_01395 [Proteobacteria bacterium]|nr:hypothetical protein [Pseudomonadota bacterium]